MVFAKTSVLRYKIKRCFLKPPIILAIDFAGQKIHWQQLEINARIDSPGSVFAFFISQLIL